MSSEHTKNSQFNGVTAKHFAADDLFLPSVIEVVRHMARIAAERDYKHFLATGEILYARSETEGKDG